MVLLGCGKMGSAMLAGWLENGLDPGAVWVIDPRASDWVKGTGVQVNADLPDSPAVVLIAVKPQQMGDALPDIAAWGNGSTLFVSVAAGTTIGHFEDVLGAASPIVRAMPNTPAAIGRGITAIVGNARVAPAQLDTAEALLAAVGQVVRLEGEHQMDAVTAVSGSGPAYVFHLIETLAAAGVAQGLPEDMAMQEDVVISLCRAHSADTLVCGHAHRWRDRPVSGGFRWIVLDAFGGGLDSLSVDSEARLAGAQSGYETELIS